MIQKTPLKVIHWDYKPPKEEVVIAKEKLRYMPLKAIQKTNAPKKGIGFRFTYRLTNGAQSILSYIGEAQFIMDKSDIVDKAEALKMVRTVYSEFEMEFEIRKAGTPLERNFLKPLNESIIDYKVITDLLK
jgi:hypothetical protein